MRGARHRIEGEGLGEVAVGEVARSPQRDQDVRARTRPYGDLEGLGEAVWAGVAVEGALAVRGLLATGTLTGAEGPLPPTTRASGTAIRPAITVTTKVAAPHSRRRNWPQFN